MVMRSLLVLLVVLQLGSSYLPFTTGPRYFWRRSLPPPSPTLTSFDTVTTPVVNTASLRGLLKMAATAKGFSSRTITSSSGSSNSTSKGGFGAGGGKQQVKVLADSTSCPCGSGQSYAGCCKALHDGLASSATDPEAITRARYTAFAAGLPGYLIDTTHPTQRDHARHREGHLDEKKARKAWEKELMARNSEVFEFLKLEVLHKVEAAAHIHNMTLAPGQEAVAYRILVRKRDDGSLITYQETAVYVPRPAGHRALGGGSKGGSSGGAGGSSGVAAAAPGWLYSHGVVSPVEESIAKRLMAEAPLYQPDATIRDKW